MTNVVVDASVVVSWFLPDEKEGVHSGLFRQISELEIHVPQIFYYELSNAFAMAVKRGRVDIKTLATILDIVWILPIHLDFLDSFSVRIDSPNATPTFIVILCHAEPACRQAWLVSASEIIYLRQWNLQKPQETRTDPESNINIPILLKMKKTRQTVRLRFRISFRITVLKTYTLPKKDCSCQKVALGQHLKKFRL